MIFEPTSAIFPVITPADAGIDADKLNQACAFIEDELAIGRFPGVALVVTRGQRTVLERTWGTYCNAVSRDEPYHTGVLNMLYSFSKVVSATVVVLSQQDGLLDYDLPVWRYVPEFRNGNKEAVTLRHLLTHSAGIPNAPLGCVLGEDNWQTAVRACCAHEIEWPAGSKTAYHGVSGMFMAAEVVRRVNDYAPWETICQQRLFQPLGAHFTFMPPNEELALALTPQPKELPCAFGPATYPALGHPGAGCFGTAADAQRLLNLHLQQGVWQGQQVIQPAAFSEMHRVQYAEQIDQSLQNGQIPAHEYWALGWLTRGNTTSGWFGFGERASETSFGHAGIDTVMSVADPERQLAITFMTTDSPKPSEATTRLRDTVTNLVVAACSL